MWLRIITVKVDKCFKILIANFWKFFLIGQSFYALTTALFVIYVINYAIIVLDLSLVIAKSSFSVLVHTVFYNGVVEGK
jgi:hypothetical protein